MTAQRNSSPGEIRRRPASRRRKIWSGPVALLLVVAALWCEWAQTEKQSQVGRAASGANSPTAAAVTGVWQGEVTYNGRPTYTERFLFQAEGDKLFGTASFLAFKRGIEDGRKMATRFLSTFGSAKRWRDEYGTYESLCGPGFRRPNSLQDARRSRQPTDGVRC